MLKFPAELNYTSIFNNPPAKDWRNNACLSWSHSPWHGHILGYKSAADELIETHLKEISEQALDATIYPILFLYRHAMELTLKSMLKLTQSALRKKEQINNTHNLHNIWSLLKKNIYETLPESKTDENISLIENFILEIHEFDKNSMTFRYSNEKTEEGSLLLSKEITHINIRELKEIMDSIFMYLNATRDVILARYDVP